MTANKKTKVAESDRKQKLMSDKSKIDNIITLPKVKSKVAESDQKQKAKVDI